MLNKQTLNCLLCFLLFLTSCSPSLLNMANDKLRTGNYQDAAVLYKQYLQEKPGALIPSRKLGYTLLKSGEADKAVIQFEDILDEFPDDSFTTLYLGLAYLQQGRRDKVLTVWEEYHSTQSSEVTKEIRRQTNLLANAAPELSDSTIADTSSAVWGAVDADRARSAYNLRRLGECG